VKTAVDSAAAELAQAEADEQRAQKLYADGAISSQQLDAARTKAKAARAALQAAQANVTAAESDVRLAAASDLQVEQRRQELAAAVAAAKQAQVALAAARDQQAEVRLRSEEAMAAKSAASQARAALSGAVAGAKAVDVRRAELRAAKDQERQAAAALALTRAQLTNTTLIAPVRGIVLERHLEPGETVATGSPVLTIANLANTWLTVYVPEDELARVRVGLPVRVDVDGFPGRAFRGRIQRIASRGEFTPRNTQTKEDRTQVVFAVKVALDNPGGVLKPGMFADVTVQPN